MSFQTPITIFEAVENIHDSRYLLPAIQREFEWPSQKIEWLFDSLLRGYPVSSFLFWRVEGASVSGYKFYTFLRCYRERYNEHNADAPMNSSQSFTAVLDGQQRLTSLYIGLMGSYAYKEKHRHWNDDEWSVPTRHLYLNLSEKLDDQTEEDGRVYEFSFLKQNDTQLSDIYKGKWFRVGKILDLRNISTFNKYIRDNEFNDLAADIMAQLHQVIFTDRIINFFLEKESDLHKALNIFIRINSGGLPLNFSDLIMSIAIANWKKKEARKEIHKLVDKVQEIGFTISKDFIFKTYLYLYSTDIRFKVTNFTRDNAQYLEQEWENIRDVILCTFELIRGFGYTDFTLTSKNAVIPIVYYLYHRGIYSAVIKQVSYKQDRDVIKKWLHTMTLKRIFGGQSDGTLAQIRHAFTDDVTSTIKIKPEVQEFPAEQINAHIKRDISVGDDFIEESLKTQKDDRYAFCILALLYPHLDYRNNDFHKDHIHPISSFNTKNISVLGLSEDDRKIFESSEWNNSIINLQLLDSNDNMSKQNKALLDWFTAESQRVDALSLRRKCIIPDNVSLEFKDFVIFSESRKRLLSDKLKQVLR